MIQTRTPEVFWILGSLLAAVTLASLIGYVLKRRNPGNPATENLNARIRSWGMMILVGGGALLTGRIAILLLFACISFLALREFMTSASGRPADRVTLLVCNFVVLPGQYLLVGAGRYELFCILIPAYCFVPSAASAFTDTNRFLDRAAAVRWGLALCVYCISYIPALMTLRIPGYESRSALLMVFLLLIAQVSDILQYVWGKLIGRHPVSPTISPSKTVEGLVGGVLSATVLGTLLWRITPFTAWQAGLMAFLVAALGFLGGLVMSAIKRDRGIKDWGHLIEGHGGMLDRMDSLCFSAPVFFHLTRYFFSQP
ncbi:MAG TPA: phosphatidate cytidylyltransferase [Bryobacteraceae bacterium]